ncbi:MAG TPA: pilus assembly protein [Cellvibrio sp.]|nr:pilus assembly protein [Cellvibrio sp.]
MSVTESVNIASLKMVQGELISTIEESAGLIEQFVTDRNNGELLQRCVEGIRQVRGILNLIQLKGVNLLAEELAIHIKDVSPGEDAKTDRQLELISAAFFMLPRYLEYCVQTSRNMGMLLIPKINELRQARRAALLPESYYFEFEPAAIERALAELAPQEANLPLLRRLRFMYQTGLLKVLQGNQVKSSLGIMCRALERLESLCGSSAMVNFFWVAAATLQAIGEEGMALSKSRKLLLGAIDREIKALEVDGQLVVARASNSAMLKDLLYLLVLSKSKSARSQDVIAAYGVPSFYYSDAELVREMEFLNGPSTNTISSMVSLLNGELKHTKNMLEHSAQGAAELKADAPELIAALTKIAEILALVGLVAPSKSLKQEVEKLRSWQAAGKSVAAGDLLSIADTLLYVESTVAGLGKTNMSDDKLTQINALERDQVMASNQIAEAETLVIDEAQTGIAVVKRALSAFAESHYDQAHIVTIAARLDGIRGGMFVLGLPRAAKVLAGCILFVEQSLIAQQQDLPIEHMLETFADAVVSLEYYLDSLKIDKNADTDVLRIAEESLEALGYKV